MEFTVFWRIFFVGGLIAVTNGEPIVTLDGGSVRGSEMTSENGNVFFAFRGIPYAEPPTGNRRFRPPVPKKPWGNELFDATKDGPSCPQSEGFGKAFVGQEDNCLVVNVYTSQLNVEDSQKRTVMVFIHGGGFMCGSGDSTSYGPQRFIDTGIVLVTFNYRVGVLGFLSTGDSASPGNYGLLDQTEALKWVKANIGHFGGDPESITIFGESAGGASVHYQTLTPLSKGLFQRAISMSGTALGVWALQTEPLIWSRKVGDRLGCPVDDTNQLVECIRKAPTKKLYESASFANFAFFPLVFAPTVDHHFLHDTPQYLLERGEICKDISFMTGVTKDEGVAFFAMFIAELQAAKVDLTKEVYLDHIQDALEHFPDKDEAIELISREYLTDMAVTDGEKMSTLLTHMLMDKSHFIAARLMAEAGIQTFDYSYDFQAPFSFTQLLGFKELLGVGHLDDLMMVFNGSLFSNFKTDDRVTRVKDTFQTLLTNFAQYGHPTPQLTDDIPLRWKPVTSKKIPVYHIDDPVSTDLYNPEDDEMFAFWTEKIPKSLGLRSPGLFEKKDEL